MPAAAGPNQSDDPRRLAARVHEVERRLEALEHRLSDGLDEHNRRLRKILRRLSDAPLGEKLVPYLPFLIELAGLEPHHTVLDVGCGEGSITDEVATYLGEEGEYHGIDVRIAPIEALRVRYANRPSFHFHHADLTNTKYNPEADASPTRYRFPLDGSSVDVVVLRSVFTHMLPDGIAHYLAEIARVLRPGGRSLITYYLLNDESRRVVEASSAIDPHRVFPYDHGIYRVKVEEVPEQSVAIDEAWLRDVYTRNGLRMLEPIRYGSWCGRAPFLSHQDIVVAEKLDGPEVASR